MIYSLRKVLHSLPNPQDFCRRTHWQNSRHIYKQLCFHHRKCLHADQLENLEIQNIKTCKNNWTVSFYSQVHKHISSKSTIGNIPHITCSYLYSIQVSVSSPIMIFRTYSTYVKTQKISVYYNYGFSKLLLRISQNKEDKPNKRERERERERVKYQVPEIVGNVSIPSDNYNMLARIEKNIGRSDFNYLYRHYTQQLYLFELSCYGII